MDEEKRINVYKNVLTELLCDDIIKLYNAKKNEKEKKYIIPKHNTEWAIIERHLYKQLLISINSYKKSLNFNDDLIIKLNTPIYTKNFIIDILEKNKMSISTSYNRYNIINYIYVLSDCNLKILFNNHTIILSKGYLILFPYILKYEIDSTTIANEQCIISGQLCNENII